MATVKRKAGRPKSDSPQSVETIRVSAEVADLLRKVAALKSCAISDYANDKLRPILLADLEREVASIQKTLGAKP